MSDLETQIAEVLAHNRCRESNPKADHPIWGYRTFSEDQREFLRGLEAAVVADLMPLFAEAKAEALREAADEVGAWGMPCIPAAQALRARADKLKDAKIARCAECGRGNGPCAHAESDCDCCWCWRQDRGA